MSKRPGLGSGLEAKSLSAEVVDAMGDISGPDAKKSKAEDPDGNPEDDALSQAKAAALNSADAVEPQSTVWLPTNVVDVIKIPEIEADTGATVEVSTTAETGRPHQRRVTITGPAEAQTKAVAQVQAVAAQSEDYASEEERVILIDIPATAAGRVIGRQGASIKLISQESGARIAIAPQVNLDNPALKRVTITGDTKSQREQAFEMVKACVSDFGERGSKGSLVEVRVLEFQFTGNVNAPPSPKLAAVSMLHGGDAQQTLSYLIPCPVSGNFIGKSGSNIQKIRESGAHVNLAPDSTSQFPNDRVLTLTGKGDALRKAVDLIEALQAQLSSEGRPVGLGFRPAPAMGAPNFNGGMQGGMGMRMGGMPGMGMNMGGGMGGIPPPPPMQGMMPQQAAPQMPPGLGQRPQQQFDGQAQMGGQGNFGQQMNQGGFGARPPAQQFPGQQQQFGGQMFQGMPQMNNMPGMPQPGMNQMQFQR